MRREGYSVFPALRFIPAKKWNLAECLWTTTPHAINVWMPVKIQFFSLKQIYKLFCNVFERLRAEHILAVSHLAFLDCYKASGTSAWNRLALPAAGKGPLRSHPGEGAPVRPSSPRWPQGCSEWPVEPRWDRGLRETVLLPSHFSFPLSLSTYHFGFLVQKGRLWLSHHPVKD